MPQSAVKQFSGIFVSYRRDDSSGHAGRLFDRLSAHFGEDQIFMDISYIEPGEDFVQVIENAVGSCEILLAIIGRNWLSSTDGASRRLDNPNDFVRLEIASALNRNIRVIPVLVHGASMPGQRDLPDDLAKLIRRNALELSDLRWKHDVDQLIGALEKVRARLREAWNDEARREDAERRQTLAVVSQAPDSQQTEPTAIMPPKATNSIGMEFVWIPPGSFMMGSKNGDRDEKPVHQVTIGEGFYMGKYTVTQTQWMGDGLMPYNNSGFKGDNLPISNVTWDTAQEFLKRLNEKNDGYEYRLPTEAEWEYACRAGTTGDYAGDLDAMAWYWKNSDDKTHPVGSKQPNGFGMYDMHGNVWEWMQDCYHKDYNGAPADGSGWLTGIQEYIRMLRGGSYFSQADNCRSAKRYKYSSDRSYGSGLRVVAVVQA